MKAKEYAQAYLATTNKEMYIFTVLAMFMGEVNTLCEMRKANSKEALKGVLTELNLKWNSFVNIVKKKTGRDDIKENAFRDYYKFKFPAVYKQCRF